MNPTVILAVSVALVTVVILVSLLRPRPPLDPKPQAETRPQREPCPLCGSVLQRGERVHSVVFATKTEDKIMEISGCPHCRPPSEIPRFCPVCKKALRDKDIVTARVFERTTASGAQKTHVHVLGCPRCRH